METAPSEHTAHQQEALAARMGTCEVPGTQAAVSVWVSLAVPRVESEAEKGN